MQKINYDKLKFVKLNNVSRETLILFESYENFLLKQNKHFNLVGSSTIQSVWTRHFADSAKLFSFIHSRAKGTKKTIEVCDVGSGAGFPGIVLSILSLQSKLNISITLFESNKKKAKFFSMNNIETWDSLNHLKLMILLQKTFKINLNSNQIATATDEKKILAVVTKKIYQK